MRVRSLWCLVGLAAFATAANAAHAETWKGYTFMPTVTHPSYKNLEEMGKNFDK